VLAHCARQPVEAEPSAVFRGFVAAGLADFPLPARGATHERLSLLRALGRCDLSFARLTEGHVDALAILAEAGEAVPDHALLGVWAAGPLDELIASRVPGGWRLDGRRRWCSGAPVLSHALVRGRADDGDRLFLVPLARAGVEPLAGTWPAVGMAGSLTLDVAFTEVMLDDDAAIGTPGFYLGRPGFWLGGIGVAAVWFGGAEGVAALLGPRVGEDPHRLAHLGAVTGRLFALDALFERAARLIDEGRDAAGVERLARIVRSETEAGASEILERTGRATGADPLGHDAAHARRVADLTVYLRQSHGEGDLAALGVLEQRRPRRTGPA
jgi:alkylation response protein AidB-like acyl-CoA dehydrogenase